MKINKKELNNIQNLIKNLDKAFERSIILVTILQATIYQFVLWYYPSIEEYKKIAVITLMFIIPILISFTFWLQYTLNIKVNKKTMKFRTISWSSTFFGFFMYVQYIIVYFLESYVELPKLIYALIYATTFTICTIIFRLTELDVIFKINKVIKDVDDNFTWYDEYFYFFVWFFISIIIIIIQYITIGIGAIP